ncbi:MAG TPA: RecQ family ATP-dependent DNA helicase [Solirubrobacteraceae bacterium]|nr:RecQ family ATP-dependent DNA helicase [Solirubrobacteraceae bacterium]
MPESIRAAAKERLGFERLRPGQLQAIAAAVDGSDVLAVLPTGAGKSAIYELAGLLRTGPTVVVSPLIALEDDQVAHLRTAGLAAVVLNSKQSARTRAAALSTAPGTDQFVFVSPEQLTNSETLEWLRRARPGLFVVDEAHLVSQWGEDFRPDYLLLATHADALGAPVRVALTATAAPPVRAQIQQRLGLRDPQVVIGDFDRPQIDLAVDRVRSAKDKQRRIEQAASELSGAGIVYAATHAGAQAARDTLAAAGHAVSLYHAGLTTAARREAMTAFLDGSARVIAATVAFGMGIDKPDVRWVLHADIPGSLDAYYQEFGRAGRDGEAAHARLLYHPSDLALARHLAARRVSGSVVAGVANRLASSQQEERVGVLADALGLSSRAATLALARLVDVNAAGWTTDGAARWSDVLSLPDALHELGAQTALEREVEDSRLEMMRRYAEHTGCRRSFLLTYFGQEYPGPCGSCDNDRHRPPPRRVAEPFAVGIRVQSGRWGEGTVQRYDGEHVTVLFDDHGYRELLVPLVLERDLLRPV